MTFKKLPKSAVICVRLKLITHAISIKHHDFDF